MDKLKALIRELAGIVRSNVWYLEGKEAASGQALRLMFAGGDRQKEYIARLVFNDSCTETWAGKLYLWNILYILNRRSRGISLAVIEGRRLHRLLYQASKDYFVPLWVRSRVEIPLKATHKSAKEDLRRIRKHQLTCDVTRDPGLLRHFYDRMYLPTIHERHGKITFSVPFEEMANVVSKGDNQLLLIKSGETAIAGVVVIVQELPRLWVAGVLDSSMSYRRIGVVGATYHFPAQYLAERGYQQMDLGQTRGFFNDGVMRYKTKWNHELTSFDRDGMIIKCLENSPGLTGFLVSQPFARVKRDGLRGTVFTENGDEPNEPLSKRLDSLRSLMGLSGVDLIVLDAP